MMQRPWDCAQPDEWLPQSLRLCWGGSSGDGGGWSGDSGGGGWSGDAGGGWGGDSGGGWGGDTGGGWGGATTGGGDWGSAGSADFSGSWAGGDVNAWAGTAYDASTAGAGAGGGGDWGSFSSASFPDSTPGAIFTDVAGPNPGVTTGGGDWGSAGPSSFAGTGGGPGGAMFGADLGAGAGAPGQLGGGGFWGDYSGGGGFTGSNYGGGGGGGLYGGGGQQGGGSFGGFGTAGTSSGGRSGGPLGASNVVAAAPIASRGETFADTVGGSSLAGPAGGRATSDAPTKGEAQVESAGDVDSGRADADADAEPASFGEPASSEAAPEAEAGSSPSLSDAAPAGMIGGSQDAAPASAGQTAAPAQASQQSNFGPQSLNADYQGSPYADMGPGPASFDSRFGDWGQQDAAPSQADDYQGSPYADMGQQPTAPDFNQAFQAFEAQPGWNPAEQTAGRAGLAEPTDWGANPFAPSTDVSVGRDFDQVFADVANQPTDYQGSPYADMGPQFAPDFGQTFQALDTPTGMDLAGDYATGVTTNLANQLGINDLTVGPGLPTSPVFGVTGMNYNTLTHDTDPTAPVNVELMQVPAPATPTPLTVDPSTTGRLQDAQPLAAPPVAPTETAPEAPPQAPPTAPPEAPESRPAEQPPEAPPQAPPQQPPEAPPQAPPQQPQTPPQQTPQTPPSLIDQAQQPPSQAPPTAPPGLTTMLPPPALTPPAQPAEAPQQQPQQQPQLDPGEHDDVPEPNDNPNPPGDPNAPRPPENIPGQVIGQNGQYDNAHADNPQGSRTYRDSGRTDYPQGRPGITFRTARQAGIEPLFRTNGVNARDVDARLVENINRALRAMEQRTGIPANSLVATSGWRPAHRGEAHEHGMDPRTSQESVYSRSNPNRGRHFAAAQPGRSNHAPGRALDFADSRARAWLRQNAREFGLETLGGTFDMPHIQLRGGGAGQQPSAQEQAEQRALDAQTRQAAIDRGLIAPGRGQAPVQQAGVPLPRGRPTDAPQPEVAQPDVARPPADIPQTPAALPPEPPAPSPVAPRPLADIPPTLTPPAQPRGRPDIGVINNILKNATAHLNKNSGQAELDAAAVMSAKELARAGIPLDMARAQMTKGAIDGAIANGYGPGGPNSTVMGFSIWGKVQSAIADSINAALQGYRPARPGEVQGPPSPFAPAAPGKRSEAPFGGLLHLAAGGRDVGAPPAIQGFPGRDYGEGEIIGNPNLMIEDRGFGAPPPAPPVGLQDPNNPDRPFIITPPFAPDMPGGPYGDRFLAKGGHVAKDEPVVVGEEGPEYFVPDRPGTVVPHQPQPQLQPRSNIDRWPKLPAVNYPGQYGGVEREMMRQTRAAQDPVPSLMDMVDSGQLRLNAANWHRMINDPSLIALGRSRIEDRR